MRRKRRRIRGEAPCRELPLPSVTGGSETQHFTPAGIILSAREKKEAFLLQFVMCKILATQVYTVYASIGERMGVMRGKEVGWRVVDCIKCSLVE